MRLPELRTEQAAAAVGQGLVLVDSYQATCSPCRTLEPRLEAFAARHRDRLAHRARRGGPRGASLTFHQLEPLP